MAKAARRRKHLKPDQGKLDLARRYSGVTPEQEAIDQARGPLTQDQRIVRRLKALGGVLRGDDRPWPYS